MIEWEIEGREMGNCNCDPGCPCQFNSLPTNGDCMVVVGFDIDRGHFGDTSLDGARAVAVMHWPGAIHEGHGEALIVFDDKTSEAQRAALGAIMTGAETEPGATIFNVFAATLEKLHDPVIAPIDLSIDVEARRGHINIAGMVDSKCGPLVNPITGAEHRARIGLPDGFEYRIAEIGKGTSRVEGPIPLALDGSHAQFNLLHMTQSGVVG